MMNSLDKQYQDLLKTILEHGIEKKDRTGTGTKSIFGYTIRHNMKDGFSLLTTKKMPFKTIMTELLWFLRGDTNIKYLVDNGCHIWEGDAYKQYKNTNPDFLANDEMFKTEKGTYKFFTQEQFINKIKNDKVFSDRFGNLGPIYGKQWRDWGGKQVSVKDGNVVTIVNDQIANLINNLKTNPDSRRLMVNAWNVADVNNGSMVLPPCHYGFQVYTRELSAQERLEWVKVNLPNIDVNGFVNNDEYSHKWVETLSDNIPTRAISLMWNQRSVDTFLGLPFNIASYGLLLEIIAKSVNMVPDQLIGNLGDTHLYLNHLDQANEQISRGGYQLPTLNINTEFWPTESGECGVGPIDATAFFGGFNNDHFCKSLLEDIQLVGYESHPTIKAPLSN